MSKLKKWIIVLAVLLISGGILAGVYLILRANREPAKVYAVAEISEFGDIGNQNYVGGEVKTDRLQTAYVSPTQEITKILVAQGDQVKKGDALVEFNTTLSELELQRKQIAIQKAEEELEKNQRAYQKLFGKRYELPAPVSAAAQGTLQNLSAADQGAMLVLLAQRYDDPANPLEPVTEPEDPVTDPEEPVTEPIITEPIETEPVETEPVATEPVETNPPVTEPQESTEPETREPEATDPEPTEPEPTEAVEDGVVRSMVFVDGKGTPEDPALYILASDFPLSREILEALLGSEEKISLVLANTEEDLLEGNVTAAWGLTLTREEKQADWSLQLLDASAYLGNPLAPLSPDNPEEPDVPDFPVIPDYPSGPSFEELQQMRKELEEKIKNLDLQIRMDKVEYKRMEAELGDGVIRAEFDGVILTLNDPDFALESGEPLLKLSGGGGYSIVCTVNEYQLSSIQLGQEVTVSSWYGDQFPATVTDIAAYPAENYWSDPSQNVSFYPVTLEVDASANMGDSYWVDVDLGSAQTGPSGFYLYKAFVLNENGKSFVYVRNEQGLLEKRFLATGRDMYGYMIEVLGGLTQEDYVAFPYAKASQEGAKTEEGNLMELQGY